MRQPRTSDVATRAAGEVVVVVSRLRRRLREVASFDLSPSQTSVLSRLSKDGPASASALAAAEGVRPQSMAATLAALDRQDLLDRRPDPDDGRRVVVSLSNTGQRHLVDKRRARQDWLVRALEDTCTERERAIVLQAMQILDRIAEQ